VCRRSGARAPDLKVFHNNTAQRIPPLSTTMDIGVTVASFLKAGEPSIAAMNSSIDFRSEETSLSG